MVTDSDDVGNESIRGNLPYEEGVRLTSDRQHRSSLGGGRGAGQWEFNHRSFLQTRSSEYRSMLKFQVY